MRIEIESAVKLQTRNKWQIIAQCTTNILRQWPAAQWRQHSEKTENINRNCISRLCEPQWLPVTNSWATDSGGGGSGGNAGLNEMAIWKLWNTNVCLLSLSPPFTYYPLATVAAWSVGLRWWQWWPLNALNWVTTEQLKNILITMIINGKSKQRLASGQMKNWMALINRNEVRERGFCLGDEWPTRGNWERMRIAIEMQKQNENVVKAKW